MKQFLVTMMMFLIVGAGTAYAQDKKADSQEATKTETVQKTDLKEGKKCAATCTKACCSKSSAHGGKDAKACKPGCKKEAAKCSHASSAAHGGKGHAGHDHDHAKKACAPGCEKACCSKKKADHGRADKDM